MNNSSNGHSYCGDEVIFNCENLILIQFKLCTKGIIFTGHYDKIFKYQTSTDFSIKILG